MNFQTRKLTLVTAISLALALAAASVGAASTAQDLIEARQEAQIWTTYTLSPYLRANDINVTVDAGKATLTGIVDEDVNRDLAKQIALGVAGITAVDNQLIIKEVHVRTDRPPTRSYADVIDDANLTTAVKSKLSWDVRTHGVEAKVSTLWGKVTLTGTAGSTETKATAGRLAASTRGVLGVDNQLQVISKPKEATAIANSNAANDLSDAWITTKVKSTFMYSNNVDSADIEVSTDKGMVTLKGRVASGAEQALAIELAKNTRGVKGVNAKALTL